MHNSHQLSLGYHFNVTLCRGSHEEAITNVSGELRWEGYGVLSQVEMRQVLKAKIDGDTRKTGILGVQSQCCP